jgi:hypothetical protein
MRMRQQSLFVYDVLDHTSHCTRPTAPTSEPCCTEMGTACRCTPGNPQLSRKAEHHSPCDP